MIEDWEVGALFWRLVDNGASHKEASEKVRHKFLNDLCGPDKDTHFYMGTILAHPKTWVVIGVFYQHSGPVWLATASPSGTSIHYFLPVYLPYLKSFSFHTESI